MASDRSPGTVDLGIIKAGGRAATRLQFRNTSPSTLEVARIATSCACLSAQVTRRRISADEQIGIEVRLDLSGDPSFAGGLSPELRLLDAAGRELFVRTFRTKVVASQPKSRDPKGR